MTDARSFDVLAAIDLRGGRVVRLRQGDFDRETAYSDDPVDVATRFADAGARWLHVVDLDGARTGVPAHGGTISAIVSAVGDRVRVELAGGLRDEAAVAAVLDLGAARAVVGTAALEHPAFAGRLVAAHGPERIAASIDVREGHAVGHGWASDAASVPAADAIGRLGEAGVATFEVTAIDRDGLLGGPDIGLYERLVAMGVGSIIASGGIATTEDLKAVRALGCTGAIVGRAIYEGRLDLRQVLRVGSPEPSR
jgi:phosphoribosylformimino-5-aminoimidazole carboxamide ribotide isomerase